MQRPLIDRWVYWFLTRPPFRKVIIVSLIIGVPFAIYVVALTIAFRR